MASQAYHDWVADGRPWKFARPITEVGNLLRAHGYTVYYQGNKSHLEHVPPEDHTPFSATGWPGKSPYPYCMAMDIMPPAPGQLSKINGKPLPSLARIAAQLRGDKIDGAAEAQFVKYINWEPQGSGGPCYHDSWTPTYSRRTSTDRGHIHVSARSDVATSTRSDGYDLVAKIIGDTNMAASQDMIDAAEAGVRAVLASAYRASIGQAPAGDAGKPDRNARDQIRAIVGGPVDQAVLLAAIASDNVDTQALADALLPGLSAALVSALPEGTLTKDEVEQVIRNVFGGLDGS